MGISLLRGLGIFRTITSQTVSRTGVDVQGWHNGHYALFSEEEGGHGQEIENWLKG
jgi:hypothetical protein